MAAGEKFEYWNYANEAVNILVEGETRFEQSEKGEKVGGGRLMDR